MTATILSSNFSTESANRRPFFFQADITDWDGECHSFEIEARSQYEAEAQAAEIANDYCIDANIITVYRFVRQSDKLNLLII